MRNASKLPESAQRRRTFFGTLLAWAYGSRRKAATLAVGVLAVFMGYGVVFGHNGLTAFAHKREEAVTLQRQATLLRQENDRLRGHVDRLAGDPGAIEHQAREELHYTRAGEVIYTLPAPPGPPRSSGLK